MAMQAISSRFRLGRNTVALLLLFGYLVLALLVLEQSRTIANQRALIRDLFRDSLELSAARLQHWHRSRQ